eukprot:TRINITY_DN39207_c0_g1_i1.p1 TRINITY_DN39207_c0_g1~~TRINITY_DN39207_c0_g1_i1.p1  ORF type:complete len:491 (-),score=32.34 TRINITY_DN39207_c0_g1_i1:321-1793(-)
MSDPYAALNIQRSASASEIRAAYLQRVLATHPDKGGSDQEFREVVAAFQVLGSALSRAHYDLHGNAPLDLNKQSCTSSRASERRQRVPEKRAVAGDGPCEYLQGAVEVLHAMSPSKRREAIMKEFTAPERKHMELVMSASKAQRKTPDASHDCSHSEDTASDSDSDEVSRVSLRANKRMKSHSVVANDVSASGHDAGSTRGITRRVYHNKNGVATVYYSAKAFLSCGNGVYLHITARSRRELALAVKDHIALNAVVEHVSYSSGRTVLPNRIQDAMTAVMHEHGFTTGSGKPLRGVGTDTDITCLFLRYVVEVRFKSKSTYSLWGPQCSDLTIATDALRRIQTARGTISLSETVCFSELQRTLQATRREFETLHKHEICRTGAGVQVGFEGSLKRASTGCAPSSCDEHTRSGDPSNRTAAQQMLDRELRFIEARDARLLNRLQRILSVGREREMKQRVEKRRRRLLHRNPNETLDETRERGAQITQDDRR